MWKSTIQYTTLNGGSLGSWVDEDRGKKRGFDGYRNYYVTPSKCRTQMAAAARSYNKFFYAYLSDLALAAATLTRESYRPIYATRRRRQILIINKPSPEAQVGTFFLLVPKREKEVHKALAIDRPTVVGVG